MPVGTIESICSPRGRWIAIAYRSTGGRCEFHGDTQDEAENKADKWLQREL